MPFIQFNIYAGVYSTSGLSLCISFPVTTSRAVLPERDEQGVKQSELAELAGDDASLALSSFVTDLPPARSGREAARALNAGLACRNRHLVTPRVSSQAATRAATSLICLRSRPG